MNDPNPNPSPSPSPNPADAPEQRPAALRVRRTEPAPRVRTGLRAGDMYIQSCRGSGGG